MKKKILIIGPCLSMGGMERAAVNTANSLENSNIEVVFVAIFKKDHFFSLLGIHSGSFITINLVW